MRGGLTRSQVRLVANFSPGAGHDSLGPIVSLPAGFFFQASADYAGEELWFSDGTPAGTGLVAEVGTTYLPQHAATLGNDAFYWVRNEALRITDGTFENTRRLEYQGYEVGGDQVAILGSRAYFFSGSPWDEERRLSLLSTDGSADGVQLHLALPPSEDFLYTPQALAFLGERLVFRHQNQFWSTDAALQNAGVMLGLPPPEAIRYRSGSG